jgi:hypothetical protein
MSPSRGRTRARVDQILVALAALASAGRLHGCCPTPGGWRVQVGAIHLDGGVHDGDELDPETCARLCGDGRPDRCVVSQRDDALPEVFCHAEIAHAEEDAGETP